MHLARWMDGERVRTALASFVLTVGLLPTACQDEAEVRSLMEVLGDDYVRRALVLAQQQAIDREGLILVAWTR
jgi:hypothetical protein